MPGRTSKGGGSQRTRREKDAETDKTMQRWWRQGNIGNNSPVDFSCVNVIGVMSLLLSRLKIIYLCNARNPKC